VAEEHFPRLPKQKWDIKTKSLSLAEEFVLIFDLSLLRAPSSSAKPSRNTSNFKDLILKVDKSKQNLYFPAKKPVITCKTSAD
jgi:hypothetical protein